jgi:hypothetical protein
MIYVWYNPTDGRSELTCTNPGELADRGFAISDSWLMIPLALGDWDCV